MDRFEAMRVFARVVERRSFTQAAEDLGLSRSTVTDAVKQLERRLGVKLLERTTRHVSPTIDGETYHGRCVALIADVEDAEAAFGGGQPRGKLRIDASGALARRFLLPELPDFLARYPDIELFLSESDRFVDPVREGIDCVLRVGTVEVGDMLHHQIASLTEITCAAPRYLERFGTPRTPDDLDAGHRMVGYYSSASGAVMPLKFCVNGEVQPRTLPTALTVNGVLSYGDAARLGLGLVQLPRYPLEDDLRSGVLVEVLPEYPPEPSPLSVLYPRNRRQTPRVRVFLDWLETIFAVRPEQDLAWPSKSGLD